MVGSVSGLVRLALLVYLLPTSSDVKSATSLLFWVPQTQPAIPPIPPRATSAYLIPLAILDSRCSGVSGIILMIAQSFVNKRKS